MSSESRKAKAGEVFLTGRFINGLPVPQMILDDADAEICDGKVTTAMSRMIDEQLAKNFAKAEERSIMEGGPYLFGDPGGGQDDHLWGMPIVADASVPTSELKVGTFDRQWELSVAHERARVRAWSLATAGRGTLTHNFLKWQEENQ